MSSSQASKSASRAILWLASRIWKKFGFSHQPSWSQNVTWYSFGSSEYSSELAHQGRPELGVVVTEGERRVVLHLAVEMTESIGVPRRQVVFREDVEDVPDRDCADHDGGLDGLGVEQLVAPVLGGGDVETPFESCGRPSR